MRETLKTLCGACRKGIHNFMADDRAQLGFGNVSNPIDAVTGTANRGGDGSTSFSREFNVSDFDSFGGDVTVGKYTEIARFKVPADTEYAWGYGTAQNPENQGYIYVDLQSGTPNPVEGTLRLKVESSTGRKTEVVKDLDTETLDASKTNREQKVPLPEQVNSAVAPQDAYLVVELDPASSNTDQTIDSGQSDVIMPITEYDLS